MLENSVLYRRWTGLLPGLNGDPGLLNAFTQLRETVSEQAKIIVHVFPQYTPHDATRHLEQLFPLADKVLGTPLYDKLNVAELSLLVFALYSHDWGMAVGDDERTAISGQQDAPNLALIPEELSTFRRARDEATRLGKSDAQLWEDYLRQTHARRSGQRLRKKLGRLSQSFAEMVARVAEGHVLDIREIRDPEQYPLHAALFGQVANVAAVATYVRLIDLLDLAEDRTPFALWSIIRPQNAVSRIEWRKHRALAPIAVLEQANVRQVVVTGTTDDPDVFAALADLKAWVDVQFAESIGLLRDIGKQHEPGLDSTVRWDINASGFEPVLLRFDFDRSAALGLLSKEVYGRQRLTFVRELLQNSVDAIDTRVELLRQSSATLDGRIHVSIATSPTKIRIEWRDNGVGMDKYTLDGYFAKIGRSWYQSDDFRRHSFAQDAISRFGVGLLSCFAVSQSLTVITKREPLLARDPHGWHVHIPSRDSHFSTRTNDQAPVGTTLILEIDRSREHTSAVEIANLIKKTALLVRHRISLSVDGADEIIEPPTAKNDPRFPFVRISSLDETALASLQSLTTQLRHHYQSPDGNYEAFFSGLIPIDASSITALKWNEWRLGNTIIDFDDLIVEEPPPLLLKGIVSGRDPRGSRYPGGEVCLNILRPSLVQPDLSRAHLDASSVNQDGLWREVALAIREAAGPAPLSIQDRVEVLSVAREIIRIPSESLDHIVPRNQWPVWALEAGSGLSWREAQGILGHDDILEAPDELSYILGGNYFESASRNVRQWSGPNCFVAIDHSSELWWASATALVWTLLEINGFVPTEIRLFASGTGDEVPLACPLWRKQAKHTRPSRNLDLPSLLTKWKKDPMLEYPEILGRGLRTARETERVPRLIRFPDGMESVAAIGSIYWNQTNPKIRFLVEALLELAQRFQRGELSGPSQKAFEYLNSTSYLGYIVPARHSSRRAAIDRYRELITIAKQEGIPAPSPLEPDDFLPGSVGKYWNPYHYPIMSWSKSEKPVGAPWTVEGR
jgi:hypothetical protein